MKKIDFKKTILSLCLVLTCLFIVAGVSAADNSDVYDRYINFPFIPGPFVEMTADTFGGSPCYWTVDSNATYGVELVNQYTERNSQGLLGGNETVHFLFHIVDKDNYFAKLNLIDCRTGEIVDSKVLNKN